MKGTMQYHGKTVATPYLPEGKELSHPFEDYFPKKDPALWFAMSVDEQNAWVRQQVSGCCVIFGEPNEGERIEAHHLYELGAGQKDIGRVPWAMISLLASLNPNRNAHERIQARHGMIWSVVKWDPLDPENGLEIIDEAGKVIPHKNLYFYNRPSNEKVAAAQAWSKEIIDIYKQYVKLSYDLATYAAAGDEHVQTLGAKSLADWGSQHGIQTSLLKMGKRVFNELYSFWDRLRSDLIPLDTADKFAKAVPEEQREDYYESMKEKCSPNSRHPSMQDWIATLREDFPGNGRTKKVTIVPSNTKYVKKSVADINEITESGLVIEGWPIGAEQ